LELEDVLATVVLPFVEVLQGPQTAPDEEAAIASTDTEVGASGDTVTTETILPLEQPETLQIAVVPESECEAQEQTAPLSEPVVVSEDLPQDSISGLSAASLLIAARSFIASLDAPEPADTTSTAGAFSSDVVAPSLVECLEDSDSSVLSPRPFRQSHATARPHEHSLSSPVFTRESSSDLDN
jgi:hypothetical protein